MAPKLSYLLSLAIILAGSSFSFASMGHFWSSESNDLTQLNECKNLSPLQRQQMIQVYQSLQDEKDKSNLLKRLDWFCKLSDDEQTRMRLAWQNMSNSERNELKVKLDSTTDVVKRAEIRREYIDKYGIDENN